MCWVNSNIFRYKGYPTKDIQIGLEVTRAGIFTEDPDIQSDCLWTLSYLLDTNDDNQIDFIA